MAVDCRRRHRLHHCSLSRHALSTEHELQPAHTPMAYSITTAGRCSQGTSCFTRRTFIFAHLSYICITKTLKFVLQAELQAQKLMVEAQSAQLQAQREAFATQERRMQEMEAFMRSVQQEGVPLPLAAPPPPTPTATPVSMKVYSY